MIVYFADRQLHVLGQASTDLPAGLLVIDDNKIEDIETGIATFEGTIPWTDDTRAECEQYIKAGNYVLRAKDEQYEAYTITEAELNTKERTAYFYAEDASLALLNEVAITYPFDDTEVSKTLTEYLTEFLSDTGFEIGRNEAENDTEESSEPFSEQTLTERLNELAQRFKYEISYSYALSADGFQIEKMYVNVYKKRGNDTGVKLFLNKDIDSITVKYNSDNLATSLLVYGPGKEELTGYTYESDENDFEVVEQYFSQDREQTHACLQSPSALNKWGRLVDGTPRHITKVFETESTEQAQMAEEAAKELSKCIEPDVNYECEIAGHLPDGVGIGDRVYIIDERGELYLKSRLIKIETSVSNNEQKVTFGEYLLQGNTVAAKVYDVSSKLDIIEDKIANGDFDGKDGEDGAYVVSIVTQYCLADGRSIPAGGDFDDLNPTPWSTEIPTYVAGKYYWTRTVTTMSDDTVIESAPTFALGIQASAEAEIAADNASSAASTAQSIANSALGLAQATDQHFWSDSTGAHISGSNYTEAVFGSSGIELYAQNVKRLGLTTSGVKIFHSDG
ncbi:MAG: phage tail protein, partial [Lachnospiraceae bacterium]|nr:phage tail protein [Lachnospiraceae bacterium]